MPTAHLSISEKLFFWQQINQSESSVQRTLAYLKYVQCSMFKIWSVPIRRYWCDKICGIREFFRCSCDV